MKQRVNRVISPGTGSIRPALVVGLLAVWSLVTFLDLDISIAVVNQQSSWAAFLERFGEIPGLLLSVGCLVLLTARINPADAPSRLLPYVGLTTVGSFGGMYVMAALYYGLVGNWGVFEQHGTWIWMALAILFVGLQEWLRRGRPEWLERLRTFSMITVGLVVLNYLLCVQVLKGVWGRVRFRELTPGYAEFTPWYLPQGLTGHTSFPSGHAAAGWLLLSLILLVPGQARKTRAVVWALVVGWGVVVAASRVRIGAHYGSDVLFSTCTGIVLFVLLRDRIQQEKQ